MLIFKVSYIIALSVFLLLFAYFNSDNLSNISLIFWKFENIPVFILAGASFLSGVLFTAILIFQDFLNLKIKSSRNKKIKQLDEFKAVDKEAKKIEKQNPKPKKKKNKPSSKEEKIDNNELKENEEKKDKPDEGIDDNIIV